MQLVQTIFVHLIRVILGAIFIYSAYAKIWPIEPFEYNFVEQGLSNWLLAPFMARIIIALEFAIGFLLIVNFQTKILIKIASFLLIFFCVYLVIQIINEGNQGNCGCFGTKIKMTPAQAIIKNVFMLGLALIVYLIPVPFDYKKWKWLMLLPVITCFSLPFALNPPSAFIINMAAPETVNYKFQNDLLLGKVFNKGPVDLTKGKHILCFFSLTCPHCRTAGYKIHIIKAQLAEKASIVMILNGEKENESLFFEETKSENVPYFILNGENYAKLSGYTLPMIMAIEDGVVKKKFDGENITLNEITAFLKLN
jgi:uncharacterized membrane protein YphA (DoxX/SURF4 family)